MKQPSHLIVIDREYGSGGLIIAEYLSEYYHIPLWGANILEEVAASKNLDLAKLQKYDERPRTWFLSRSVRGHHSAPETLIYNLQADFIRRQAEEGNSFIVLGRCAEQILKQYPACTSFFILGDRADKIRRVMDLEHLNKKKAEAFLVSHDRIRKQYHNHHTDSKWGDSRNYDLCVNSSRLGYEKTAKLLIDFIDNKKL